LNTAELRRFLFVSLPAVASVAVAAVLVATLLDAGTAVAPDGSSESAVEGPRVGRDHWHATYKYVVCGQAQPNFPTWEAGVHTHADGIIHIHPFTPSEEGSGARLVKWFEYGGGKLTDDEVRAPGSAKSYKNDDLCPDGRAGVVQVSVNGEKLADWSLPFSAADKVVYGASRWTGVDDVSGKFALGWDASYLYVAIQVIDDKYVQVASGADIWMGDEVEVQFDADLAADYYTASLSADDTQLGLSLGNFGSIPAQAHRWFPQSQRGPAAGVSVAGKATPQGYDVEARIPWTVFGVTPAEGGRYGFALSISDDDLAGIAAQQSMVSSVSTRTLVNPTTWGTLALGGGPE